MRATVIGNIFVDVKGTAMATIHKHVKNAGRVEIVHGGVGRNVSHNLSVLGSACRLVACCTSDAFGREVIQSLMDLDIDTSFIQSFPTDGMGVWLAVLGPTGELEASISQQPDPHHQEAAVLGPLHTYLQDTALLGLDVCMSPQINKTVIEAARERNIPVYGVIGNLNGLKNNLSSIEGIHGLICNAEEARALTGSPVRSMNEAIEAAYVIREHGVRSVIITLSSQGCLVYENVGAYHRIEADQVIPVDTTGAGDAFAAGLLHAIGQGFGLADAARFGTRVAGQVVASKVNTLTAGRRRHLYS